MFALFITDDKGKPTKRFDGATYWGEQNAHNAEEIYCYGELEADREPLELAVCEIDDNDIPIRVSEEIPCSRFGYLFRETAVA
jgi:hypothetical protein